MPIFNQNALVKKLNLYLETRNRNIKLDLGYCHGLTLLWLHYISNNKVNEFYILIKKIVNANTDSDFESFANEIETLLAHLEWLQNPDEYINNIDQMDIDQLMLGYSKLSLSGVITPRQFMSIFDIFAKPHLMICLSGPEHTIGLYILNHQFFLYDPNYIRGEAKIFNNKKKLIFEIIESLFLEYTTKRIALQVNLISTSNHLLAQVNKSEFLKSFSSLEDITATDALGNTSLYLACQNNDLETTTFLLKKGASPNVAVSEGGSLLLYVTQRGYDSLLGILLDHGAKINFSNSYGIYPLYRATYYNHLNTVILLLQHGANPLQKTHSGSCALSCAIKNQLWKIFFNMVPYVDQINFFIETHTANIRRDKDNVLKAFTEVSETWTLLQRKNIASLLKQIFDENYRQHESCGPIRRHRRYIHNFFPYPRSSLKKHTNETDRNLTLKI